MTPEADRNFDTLAHRFKRNVYDRLKGDIRLAVLKRDLEEHIPPLVGFGGISVAEPGLALLDAGGGQGNLSLGIASLGHTVDICDISANMLSLARERVESQGLSQRVSLFHQSIQDYCGHNCRQYDVVFCHAVLEWVVEPEHLLACLLRAVKPGGYLSLTFYNVNGMMMKNLLRTNFTKVLNEDYKGYRGSLTPTYPRKTDDVLAWMAPLGLEQVCHSGIRCFHDYILDPEHRLASPEEQLALELRLSKEEPFRSLGRYIHLLYKKPDNSTCE